MTAAHRAEEDAALVAQHFSDALHGHEAHAVAVADDEDERAWRPPGERDPDEDADRPSASTQ